MSNSLTDIQYDTVRQTISDFRKTGHSWEDIRNKWFLKHYNNDFKSWNDFCMDCTPGWIPINEYEWEKLVDMMEEEEKERRRIEKRGDGATLASNDELNQTRIPQRPGTSWKIYLNTLKKKGFSDSSLERIEKETFEILQHLSIDTTESGPVKGLVIGNVQSGKTASMAGLMAMAADNGWNYFIVLTGLNENLREQTETRLRQDLKGDNSGNLIWDYIGYSKMEDKHFEYSDFNDSRRVFFSVCLKNDKRLRLLLNFLHRAPRPDNLKILIIDDEADQGSINTGDIENESDRKTLNKLILRLVYDKAKKTAAPFCAQNYVSYTATPYANCLNEFKSGTSKKTLYPEHFITRISPGPGYLGPDLIFGLPGTGTDERLNIVNFIPEEQVKEIKDLENEDTCILPESLEQSILWFICAAAVQRYRGVVKPVSMLIHTSFKVSRQDALYTAITTWLKTSTRSSITDKCAQVYAEQTRKFTVEDFRKAAPEYEASVSEVLNYPEFRELYPYIQELIDTVTSIRLDAEHQDELTYNKGILVCEDNSTKNGYDEDGNHLRLVYPDRNTLKKMGYAPAFMVIGGNTLARGLTIEGLVSSFFLRHSIQADALMQMGRWFGYRTGYELLPRIWMTEVTFDKFQFLVDIDQDLRSQIEQLHVMGKKPVDFYLSLLTSPKATWLRLTANNKMQSARKIFLDYSGSDLQLTVYPASPEITTKNNQIITDFLNSLGSPEASEVNHSLIWRNIPFQDIDNAIFEDRFDVARTSRVFQDIDSLVEWIKAETGKNHFQNWTVILAGTRPSDNNSDNFSLSEHSIGKVKRSWTRSGKDQLSVKALINKGDFIAHLREKDFLSSPDAAFTWENIKSDKHISRNYRKYIQAAKTARNTPLLVIYCIDKDSREKGSEKTLADIGISEGIFGMGMAIPGIRGEKRVSMQIDSKFYEDGDTENAD